MKSAKRRRRIKRRSRNNVKKQDHLKTTPGPLPPKTNEALNTAYNSAADAAGIWRGIYESLVFRQCELKTEYWKQRAQYLEKENEELRNQLSVNLPVYETSSEEENNEDAYDEEERRYLEGGDEEYDDEDLSPEYLEFRSVTLKHREELRLQREKERMANNIDQDDLTASGVPQAKRPQ